MAEPMATADRQRYVPGSGSAVRHVLAVLVQGDHP